MYSKKSCIISLLVQCCKFLDYSLLTFELSETYPDVDQTEIIYINYLVTVTKSIGSFQDLSLNFDLFISSLYCEGTVTKIISYC